MSFLTRWKLLDMLTDLKLLRRNMRKQRRQISRFQHRQTEIACLNQLRRFAPFQNAKKVGLYLNAFGEVHTEKIILYCFLKHKKVYLPIICNMNQTLRWVEVSKQQYLNKRFVNHPLGMKEPMYTRGQHISTLDLLVLPLVACDTQGTRIGMGGGFYDKTLATARYKPYRLGLAHHFQMHDEIFFRQRWDQPLDGLLTPQYLYGFKRKI